MSFRDQLAGLIAEDKKDSAAKVFDALDKQLEGYDDDIKTLKKSLREKDGIKPEDFAALESERDELKKALTESERAAKKTAKELAEAIQAVDGERGAVSKLVLETGLTDALTKAGVRAELIPAARAYLKEKGILSVESEGDVRKAVAKLVKDGKEEKLSIDDYVSKHFATSDEGKAFIPAGGNAGGGAGSGQKNGGAVSRKTQAEISALDPKGRAELFKSGGIALD